MKQRSKILTALFLSASLAVTPAASVSVLAEDLDFAAVEEIDVVPEEEISDSEEVSTSTEDSVLAADITTEDSDLTTGLHLSQDSFRGTYRSIRRKAAKRHGSEGEALRSGCIRRLLPTEDEEFRSAFPWTVAAAENQECPREAWENPPPQVHICVQAFRSAFPGQHLHYAGSHSTEKRWFRSGWFLYAGRQSAVRKEECN